MSEALCPLGGVCEYTIVYTVAVYTLYSTFMGGKEPRQGYWLVYGGVQTRPAFRLHLFFTCFTAAFLSSWRLHPPCVCRAGVRGQGNAWLCQLLLGKSFNSSPTKGSFPA